MDRNSLELIINSDKSIKALDRFLIDSGKLHLICYKIGRTNDNEKREELIGKMKWANKSLAESIVNLAAVMSTLRHNPQSPVVQ
jgi:thiamine biosynthesis protein ThiC